MSAVRRPIIDPRAVPIVGTDEHLPPVATERLQPDALRRRLATASDWSPTIIGDAVRLDLVRSPAAASVLVPLVVREDGLHVLLTRRTDHLKDHAGQISFPGGRAEPEDANDPARTALREAEEEVGLPPAQVDVIGRLPPYTTVTAFVVTPVIGLLCPPLTLRPDPSEVAEAFEVPLAFLMNPAHHRRHRYEADGLQRQFLSMPWRGAGADGQVREYYIWGATAAMLRNLYHFLAEPH